MHLSAMGQQRTYLKWDQFGFPLASRDRFETLQCLRDWAVAKCAVCFAYGHGQSSAPENIHRENEAFTELADNSVNTSISVTAGFLCYSVCPSDGKNDCAQGT